ncbi:hypothetical protein DY000_02049044 [Brassica cretica]|uniref:Uncharacterized protein n=1 Tax=Brassica cretica TaxID=69181 RepID=A0ABQ7EWH3_BRACR|nr:hypothetical protein DY000_02049044 [Brassica cretica]
MDFGWASRMVHYMLCFHLECKKKFEIWSLVEAQPVRFCEYVKNLENQRLRAWSPEDQLHLGASLKHEEPLHPHGLTWLAGYGELIEGNQFHL